MRSLVNRSGRSHYPFGMIDDSRSDIRSIYNGFDTFRNSNYQDLYSGMGNQFYENKSHYLISVDIPGVEKSDIDINFEGQVLSISASRKFSSSDEKETYSSSASFNQSFSIPGSINEDEIKAIHENGVLKIAIPKSDRRESKKINLSEGEDSGFFKKIFSSEDSKQIDVDTQQ